MRIMGMDDFSGALVGEGSRGFLWVLDVQVHVHVHKQRCGAAVRI